MKNTKIWIIGCAVLSGLTLSGIAFAGTYNFYFNNTEQGDNSTATPAVTVQADDQGDVKAVKKTGGDEKPLAVTPALVEEPAPSPSSVAPPVPMVQHGLKTDATWERPNQFKHFSLGLGAIGFAKKNSSSSNYDSSNYSSGSTYNPDTGFYNSSTNDSSSSSSSNNSGGLMITLGYDFNMDVGLRAFAATFSGDLAGNTDSGGTKARLYGADFELTPIHVAAFKQENFLDFGVFAGASVDGASQTKFFAGPRFNLNFSNTWDLTSSLRFSGEYTMFEIGVAVRI